MMRECFKGSQMLVTRQRIDRNWKVNVGLIDLREELLFTVKERG